MNLNHLSPVCHHGMDRNNFTFLAFLRWMYVYKQTFYSVEFVHILFFCNAYCRTAENMVMMVITMDSSRRSGYLRTANFESVYKTPHLLLYSSISVHCHTVNSLIRLPHSMLTVLNRNLPVCHFIGNKEE